MNNEVTGEIWTAFKEQVLSKTWFKILLVVLLLFFAWLIYFLIGRSPVTIGEIGNENVWKSYGNVIELEKGDTEVTIEEINSEQIDTVINMYFFMAKEGNKNLFTSAIDNERLVKDFEQFPLNERFNKYDEAMKRISRNGTISKIEVIRTIPHLQKNTDRIVLDLYYENLSEPIRVSVLVTSYEQYDINQTEGETYQIPYISSSVWDLIDTIENGEVSS